MTRRSTGFAALAAYVATVPAANWMISNIGTQPDPHGPHLIPVGFGLMAPSGVLAIGLALLLRDVVHERIGKRWAFAGILAGTAMSLIVASPALAAASAAAFAFGELSDFVVYTPLTKRNRPIAVLASGVVGGIVDSILFLMIAFGSISHWQGQVWAKSAIAALGALLIWTCNRDLPDWLTARKPDPVRRGAR